jgi:hypothetical protein
MKTFARVTVFAVISSLALYAQHGGGRGAGGGGSAGGPPAGVGSSGGGSGMGSSHSGHDAGQPGSTSHGDMGKQSPSDVLGRNSKLSSNLEKVLPKGMTAQQACAGFGNLGQCVAAAHVSKNLGIPFDDLKAKMTGSSGESLGKAIQDLKPDADAKGEVKKAKKQADHDLSEAES